ncbi:uncharacterized protein BJX67DRAFT_382021 [Aspergillus lucknowensis]|uniref:Uncharacterized protein n=1 Tax=Aspergillus lucknowensis TaxID=176173 RepID=A0ABR4LNT9_9EURO
MSGQQSVSSLCRDVAYGLEKVFGSCTRGDTVSGFNAAGGNGGLIVDIGDV